MESQQKVPTGCNAITTLLNGGYERGAITQLYGSPGAGKTNLALAAAVEVIAAGGTVCIIDTEGLSVSRVDQLLSSRDGLENALEQQVLLKEAYNFEQQQNAVEAVADIADQVELVVLDSATGFYRLERGINERDDGGDMLRAVGRQFTTLLGLARKHDFAVITTNQVYNDIESGVAVRALGGNVLGHWSAAMLEVSEEITGKRNVQITKHRSLETGGCAQFDIGDTGLESVSGAESPVGAD